MNIAIITGASSGLGIEFYKEMQKECLDEILHGGYITDKGVLESVSVDGAFVDTPLGRVVNPGHSMEAAWFIMAEGIIAQNDEAIKAAKKIIDITLPLLSVAFCSGFLFFFSFEFCVEKNALAHTPITSAESISAAHKTTPNPRDPKRPTPTAPMRNAELGPLQKQIR